MPHVSYRPGPPLPQRSPRRVFLEFIVAPLALGGTLLGVMASMTLARWRELTPTEWTQLAFGVLLVGAVMACLPVVGWTELRRRSRR